MVLGSNCWNPRQQWESKGKETFWIQEKHLLNRYFIFSNEVTLAMTDVDFSVAPLFLLLLSEEGLGRLGSPPLSPWSPSGEPPGQLELFVQCQKSDTSSLLKLSLSLRDVLTRAPPQEAHHRARRPTHSQTLTSFSQLFPLWQKPQDHRLGDLRDLDLVKNCTLGVQRLHFTWFLVLNCSISDLSI